MQAVTGALARRYPLLAELFTVRLRAVAVACAAVLLSINLGFFAHSIATSENYVTVYGPVAGGDFVVFDAAAQAAHDGDAAGIYRAETMSERLKAAFDPERDYRLTWQYPPTMLLLILPLAALPYLLGFATWIIAGAAALFASLRSISSDRASVFLCMASPAAFQSMITGQTGFFTGALLATAGLFAKERPILAGICAGLLTVKPQLGLLIPVAFAAAGCWRAFAAATLTGLALILLSIAVFGAEPWTAFFAAVTNHGSIMDEARFPHYKLITVFGATLVAGGSGGIAAGLQIALTASLVAVVALAWRSIEDARLRMAILCAAAPLAAPYAFYYEAALVIAPLLAFAAVAAERGWRPGERPALAVLWIGCLFLPGAGLQPFPLGFALAAVALGLVLRRAREDLILTRPAQAGRNEVL